jgi:uncharacterized protein YdcH (DUF465 family)
MLHHALEGRRSTMAEAPDLKIQLLATNEEYRQLATRHHELDGRLHELTSKQYLSNTEHVEQVTLKKRKLQVKDRMEEILRLHRNGVGGAAMTA